jgi:pyridoxal 5'-phosphate synthase pdxT subunit
MVSQNRIGVLAMQGAFEAHFKAIEGCFEKPLLVKKPEDLSMVKAIFLPGGESTTQFDMLEKSGLNSSLTDFVKKGYPVFATCAGVILLSRLNLLPTLITRNAYGSQKYSFETFLEIPEIGDKPFEGIFIRAPKITKIEKEVEVLSFLNKDPVLIRFENILAATFHPELTSDLRIHQYFFKTLF